MSAGKLSPEVLEQILAALPAPGEAPTTGSDAPLLRQLVSLNRGLLSKIITERRCQAGEIVFHEGEQGNAMYLIQAGRIAALKGSLDTPTILGCRGPGEVVGEMALLEEKPRSATIVALEPLRLLRISHKKFHQLLSREPAIGIRIMEMLSARLRAADQVLASEAVSGRQMEDRISELQQEKLQLVELERMRQETIDTVVHDLRNPLSSIQAAVQMLEIALPEEILEANRQLLNVANSACEDMQRMVNALLDVTKIETGEIQLKPIKSNLQHLLGQVTSEVAMDLEQKQLELRTVIPSAPPTVRVDREVIGRVLRNLIDRAIRETAGGGQIILSAEVRENEVLVGISDGGAVLAPEEREFFFERPVPGRQGPDLSLIFCKLAVEAHGGSLWAETDQETGGNQIAFTLPLAANNP